MTIVVLKLAVVKRQRQEHLKRCPTCEGETFQRWGQVSKPVKDVKIKTLKVYRYYCCRCKRTFRNDPDGVGRADQTERLKQFARLCWTLGLSYRDDSPILNGWAVDLGRMNLAGRAG